MQGKPRRMYPRSATPAGKAKVFIVAMRSERVGEVFPVVRGLPPKLDVFVVVTESGEPVLITDTRAEAMRQVSANRRYTLTQRH